MGQDAVDAAIRSVIFSFFVIGGQDAVDAAIRSAASQVPAYRAQGRRGPIAASGAVAALLKSNRIPSLNVCGKPGVPSIVMNDEA